jgi:hypothetical protein
MLQREKCYNESGGILFTMESLVIVFTKERLFMQVAGSIPDDIIGIFQ